MKDKEQFEIKEILPKVFFVKFINKYELCMSFIRIQEFYESPEFAGKYFTLEDYIDYWSLKFGNGSFTYPSVWNGFNIPGDVIEKWFNVFSKNNNDIRERENVLITELEHEIAKKNYDFKDIYVIGAHSNQESKFLDEVVNHESAHALYRLYPKYRKLCNSLLKKVPSIVRAKAEGKLALKGYSKKVFSDEMQAYFSAGDPKDKNFGALKGRNEFIKNFVSFKKKIAKKV